MMPWYPFTGGRSSIIVDFDPRVAAIRHGAAKGID